MDETKNGTNDHFEEIFKEEVLGQELNNNESNDEDEEEKNILNSTNVSSLIMLKIPTFNLAPLREAFEACDGGLELADFLQVFVRNMALVDEEDLIRIVPDLVDFFDLVDINGDGSMEWSEFVMFVIEQVVEDDKSNIYEKIEVVNRQVMQTPPSQQFVKCCRYVVELNKLVLIVGNEIHIYETDEHSPSWLGNSLKIKLRKKETEESKKKKDESMIRERRNKQLSEVTAFDFQYIGSVDIMVILRSDMSFEFLKFLSRSKIASEVIVHFGFFDYPTTFHKVAIRDVPNQPLRLFAISTSPHIDSWQLQVGMVGPVHCSHHKQLADHTDFVRDILVIHNDSYSYLVTGGLDGKVHLYDLLSLEHRTVRFGSSSGIESLAFDHRTTLLAGSFDHKIIAWDLEVQLNRPSFQLWGHNDTVVRIVAFDFCNRCFSLDSSGELKLWDITRFSTNDKEAREIHSINYIEDKARCFDVIPRSTGQYPSIHGLILTAQGRSQSIYKLADTSTRESAPIAVLFSTSLQMVITVHSHDIILWNMMTGDEMNKIENILSSGSSAEKSYSEISASVMDDRGKKLFLGDSTGCVICYNCLNRSKLKAFPPLPGPIRFLLYSPDKVLLAVTSNGYLSIIDDLVTSEDHPPGSSSNSSSGEVGGGGGMYLDNAVLREVRVIDHSSMASKEAECISLCYSHPLGLIATLDSQGLVKIWNFQFLSLEVMLSGQLLGCDICQVMFLDPYPLLLLADSTNNFIILPVGPAAKTHKKRLWRVRNHVKAPMVSPFLATTAPSCHPNHPIEEGVPHHTVHDWKPSIASSQMTNHSVGTATPGVHDPIVPPSKPHYVRKRGESISPFTGIPINRSGNPMPAFHESFQPDPEEAGGDRSTGRKQPGASTLKLFPSGRMRSYLKGRVEVKTLSLYRKVLNEKEMLLKIETEDEGEGFDEEGEGEEEEEGSNMTDSDGKSFNSKRIPGMPTTPTSGFSKRKSLQSQSFDHPVGGEASLTTTSSRRGSYFLNRKVSSGGSTPLLRSRSSRRGEEGDLEEEEESDEYLLMEEREGNPNPAVDDKTKRDYIMPFDIDLFIVSGHEDGSVTVFALSEVIQYIGIPPLRRSQEAMHTTEHGRYDPRRRLKTLGTGGKSSIEILRVSYSTEDILHKESVLPIEAVAAWSAHTAAITSLQIVGDAEYILSSGEDSVVNLHSLRQSDGVTSPLADPQGETYPRGFALGMGYLEGVLTRGREMDKLLRPHWMTPIDLPKRRATRRADAIRLIEELRLQRTVTEDRFLYDPFEDNAPSPTEALQLLKGHPDPSPLDPVGMGVSTSGGVTVTHTSLDALATHLATTHRIVPDRSLEDASPTRRSSSQTLDASMERGFSEEDKFLVLDQMRGKVTYQRSAKELAKESMLSKLQQTTDQGKQQKTRKGKRGGRRRKERDPFWYGAMTLQTEAVPRANYLNELMKIGEGAAGELEEMGSSHRRKGNEDQLYGHRRVRQLKTHFDTEIEELDQRDRNNWDISSLNRQRRLYGRMYREIEKYRQAREASRVIETKLNALSPNGDFLAFAQLIRSHRENAVQQLRDLPHSPGRSRHNKSYFHPTASFLSLTGQLASHPVKIQPDQFIRSPVKPDPHLLGTATTSLRLESNESIAIPSSDGVGKDSDLIATAKPKIKPVVPIVHPTTIGMKNLSLQEKGIFPFKRNKTRPALTSPESGCDVFGRLAGQSTLNSSIHSIHSSSHLQRHAKPMGKRDDVPVHRDLPSSPSPVIHPVPVSTANDATTKDDVTTRSPIGKTISLEGLSMMEQQPIEDQETSKKSPKPFPSQFMKNFESQSNRSTRSIDSNPLVSWNNSFDSSISQSSIDGSFMSTDGMPAEGLLLLSTNKEVVPPIPPSLQRSGTLPSEVDSSSTASTFLRNHTPGSGFGQVVWVSVNGLIKKAVTSELVDPNSKILRHDFQNVADATTALEERSTTLKLLQQFDRSLQQTEKAYRMSQRARRLEKSKTRRKEDSSMLMPIQHHSSIPSMPSLSKLSKSSSFQNPLDQDQSDPSSLKLQRHDTAKMMLRKQSSIRGLLKIGEIKMNVDRNLDRKIRFTLGVQREKLNKSMKLDPIHQLLNQHSRDLLSLDPIPSSQESSNTVSVSHSYGLTASTNGVTTVPSPTAAVSPKRIGRATAIFNASKEANIPSTPTLNQPNPVSPAGLKGFHRSAPPKSVKIFGNMPVLRADSLDTAHESNISSTFTSYDGAEAELSLADDQQFFMDRETLKADTRKIDAIGTEDRSEVNILNMINSKSIQLHPQYQMALFRLLDRKSSHGIIDRTEVCCTMSEIIHHLAPYMTHAERLNANRYLRERIESDLQKKDNNVLNSIPLEQLKVLRSLFDFFDKDRSGQLDVNEIMSVLKATLVNRQKEASEMFQTGEVSGEMDEGMVIRMIQTVDADNNLELNFEEFVTLFKDSALSDYTKFH